MSEGEEWRKLQPTPMVLLCPKCQQQHLDIGEFATRVHRKHLCENTPAGKTGCGHLWVPFEGPTTGVAAPDFHGEVERLKTLINRDQTGLAAALGAVINACRGSWWITEGRGSYEYDDDRYRQETKWHIERVMKIADEALNRSGKLAQAAFYPSTQPVQTYGELEHMLATRLKKLERAEADVRGLQSYVVHLGELLAKKSEPLDVRKQSSLIGEAVAGLRSILKNGAAVPVPVEQRLMGVIRRLREGCPECEGVGMLPGDGTPECYCPCMGTKATGSAGAVNAAAPAQPAAPGPLLTPDQLQKLAPIVARAKAYYDAHDEDMEGLDLEGWPAELAELIWELTPDVAEGLLDSARRALIGGLLNEPARKEPFVLTVMRKLAQEGVQSYTTVYDSQARELVAFIDRVPFVEEARCKECGHPEHSGRTCGEPHPGSDTTRSHFVCACGERQEPKSKGEAHDPGHPHLISGEFQSDKYPTTPRGKVPLSCKDKSAQDLLWTYAERRRSVDREFAADLEVALRNAGYEPEPQLMLDLRRLAARNQGAHLPANELAHLLGFIDARRV